MINFSSLPPPMRGIVYTSYPDGQPRYWQGKFYPELETNYDEFIRSVERDKD